MAERGKGSAIQSVADPKYSGGGYLTDGQEHPDTGDRVSWAYAYELWLAHRCANANCTQAQSVASPAVAAAGDSGSVGEAARATAAMVVRILTDEDPVDYLCNGAGDAHFACDRDHTQGHRITNTHYLTVGAVLQVCRALLSPAPAVSEGAVGAAWEEYDARVVETDRMESASVTPGDAREVYARRDAARARLTSLLSNTPTGGAER